MFVIGGVTGEQNSILDDLCYLDLKTWTWSRTWSFTPRFDHAAWVWGGRLWIFGGLGSEMDRTTDLWWLDLKGSPSLDMPMSQGIDETPGSLNRVTLALEVSLARRSNYLVGQVDMQPTQQAFKFGLSPEGNQLHRVRYRLFTSSQDHMSHRCFLEPIFTCIPLVSF